MAEDGWTVVVRSKVSCTEVESRSRYVGFIDLRCCWYVFLLHLAPWFCGGLCCKVSKKTPLGITLPAQSQPFLKVLLKTRKASDQSFQSKGCNHS